MWIVAASRPALSLSLVIPVEVARVQPFLSPWWTSALGSIEKLPFSEPCHSVLL